MHYNDGENMREDQAGVKCPLLDNLHHSYFDLLIWLWFKQKISKFGAAFMQVSKNFLWPDHFCSATPQFETNSWQVPHRKFIAFNEGLIEKKKKEKNGLNNNLSC